MRLRVFSLCSGLCFAAACASSGGGAGSARAPVTEYEIAYDDNRPGDATALGSTTFEQMVRFAPSASSYRMLRLRALLSQAGRVRWSIYAQDALEQPGELLARWERDYPSEMASGPGDGKWVVEDLTARIASTQRGPVWVAFGSAGGDPRLWTSSMSCNNAFVRDTDPSRFLKPMPVRTTPMIRLDWVKD
jgi:hypothetical protein